MKHDEILLIAKQIAGSRLFRNASTVEQAFVLILAGTEIGLTPLQSVANISIENSKMTLSAGVIAGIIQRSERYNYSVLENTSERCQLEFFDGGKSVGVSTFTMDDAKLAGIDQKDTWKRYPKSLLFARALTSGMRTFCPGVIGQAIYTSEELDGTTPSVPAPESTTVQEPEKVEQTADVRPVRVPPSQELFKKLLNHSKSNLLSEDERMKLVNALPGYDEIEALKVLGALENLLISRSKMKSNGKAA